MKTKSNSILTKLERETLYSLKFSIEIFLNRIQYDYYMCNAINLKETNCVEQSVDDTATQYTCIYDISICKYVYKLTVQLNTYNDTYLIELKCSNNVILQCVVIAQNYDLMLNNIVFNLIKYNETMYV